MWIFHEKFAISSISWRNTYWVFSKTKPLIVLRWLFSNLVIIAIEEAGTISTLCNSNNCSYYKTNNNWFLVSWFFLIQFISIQKIVSLITTFSITYQTLSVNVFACVFHFGYLFIFYIKNKRSFLFFFKSFFLKFFALFHITYRHSHFFQ